MAFKVYSAPPQGQFTSLLSAFILGLAGQSVSTRVRVDQERVSGKKPAHLHFLPTQQNISIHRSPHVCGQCCAQSEQMGRGEVIKTTTVMEMNEKLSQPQNELRKLQGRFFCTSCRNVRSRFRQRHFFVKNWTIKGTKGYKIPDLPDARDNIYVTKKKHAACRSTNNL